MKPIYCPKERSIPKICRICGLKVSGKFRDHDRCVKRAEQAKRDLAGTFTAREGR